jgi:hypothetical protein
LKSH